MCYAMYYNSVMGMGQALAALLVGKATRTQFPPLKNPCLHLIVMANMMGALLDWG